MKEPDGNVTIVTQTCVRPEAAEAFARWQGETSTLMASLPGFIEQRLMPPKPPLQVDWVILQRFENLETARAWLSSPERLKRLDGAAPMLVGRDDVHIVHDEKQGRKPAPVSAVISTRVLPGKESEYRAWERKIAIAQSKAPGLRGYRFEPPVPGVQEDFVAILRFDTAEHLQGWLNSPERKRLIDDAAPLTAEFHARLAHTGFEQWFRDESLPSRVPAWKQNMLVLLLLYPIVFLFGVFIQTPLLTEEEHLPFAAALFIGNMASVLILSKLVPWVSGRFAWWLNPSPVRKVSATVLGTAIVLAAYATMVVAFWRLF
ncbi:MAG: antibiotic biosynthesis monooxygenase [Rhizobiaceae bacterium]